MRTDTLHHQEMIRMKVFRIKDNNSRRKEDFRDVSSLVNIVANKTMLKLEQEGVFIFPEIIKDSDDITKDQMILQGINDCYQSGNVMGYIGYGEERLIIESRFSNGEEDFFFQYLLERVLEVPNIVDLKVEANQRNRIYNLLLFMFPHYLKSAMRKGLFKTYIRRCYNDENVRGSIDIARHISKNTPFQGNIAYNQREYDFDNYLIELIRHAIEYINGKSYGSNLLGTIKDEVKLIVDATPKYRIADRRKVVEYNQNHVVRHAFYHEYRALQQLCLLILRNEKNQIGLGTRRMYGILFDGAWLWEEYINKLVGDKYYHPMNKSRSGAQWLFAGNNGLIYPDFIGKNANNRIIADAKYKPEENIRNKDYLQIVAYMYRFDARRGAYFYPESKEGTDEIFRLNCGISHEKNVKARNDVIILKHGLKIPQKVSGYLEFKKLMKKNETCFISELKAFAE